jgi:hypothetical protein
MDRHHNAPPLAERLEIDHAALATAATEAAALVPAELAPIASDEDAGGYAETAKALKEVVGTTGSIEKARKQEKDQILKDGRTVDAFFAGLADAPKKALDRVLGEINRYQRAKLEAERKAAAEREAAERKAAALFDEAPPPPVAPIAVKEVARVMSFSGVKATASTKWVHRVIDPEKVPRQYLMVNEAAIKAAIAGGMRSIDGVEIYEDVRTAIR